MYIVFCSLEGPSAKANKRRKAWRLSGIVARELLSIIFNYFLFFCILVLISFFSVVEL